MSGFKGVSRGGEGIVGAAFGPEELMIGPPAETIAVWDHLLGEGRRVVGIGNSDAHGTTYRMGPVRHVIFTYDFLFNCVNTHILLTQPLTGEMRRDKQMIYKAIAQGNVFIGYDIPGNTRGFRFSATGQYGSAIMGGSIRLGPGVTLPTLAPARSPLKIICHGKVVAESGGREKLTFQRQTSRA